MKNTKFAALFLAGSLALSGSFLSACGGSGSSGNESGGHSMLFVAAVDPTCTRAGNVAYWHCTDCALDFADEEGRQEISDVTVASRGHDLGTVIVSPATCETDGLMRTFCSHCDYQVDETIPSSGHRFGEYGVKILPTCTQDGIEVRRCENCSAEETRAIKAFGHNIGPDNKCTFCGLVFAPTEGLAFAHVIENGTVGYEVNMGTAQEQNIFISRYYNGLPVVGIAEKTFRGSNVRAVAIYAKDIAIGDGAFCDCSHLREVI